MSRNTRKQRFTFPILRRPVRKAPKFVRKNYRFENLETRTMLAADMIGGGDLNGDTNVNGADFLHWQRNFPTANVAQAQADLAAWQTNFGATNVGGNHGHTSHPPNPAAMALVSLDQATHTVVASGNWSDPSVWQDGTLPTAGARIVIPEGMTLTVDGQIAEEIKTIRIDGTLQFATDVNTELRVDTIVSSPTGCFVMGTANNPIAAGVTARVVFADDGAIDQSWDPQQLSRGAVLQGPVDIHGAETTHRVTLATYPSAGATSIQLSSAPTSWNVGDQIVITGTQGSTSDEVRTIRSIDGTTVELNQALQLDHIPPKSDLNVYVANTTRNVEFTSENTNIPRRGHIMFMHQLNVNVKNASFNELGRTDKNRPLDDIIFDFTEDAVGNETSAGVDFTTSEGDRTNIRGRYAIHFHRGGTDPSSHPALIEGSVVNGSPGWGFVNHSGNVNMVNNVAYGVQGAAFYTEAGDEIGSLVGNIAIRTVSPTFVLDDEGAIDPDLRADVQDFGVDGDGYWLSGHLVSMRDNVSAGASGHGIIIWSNGLVEEDRGRATVKTADIANGNLITGRDTIPTWWAPLAEISNNESYGATVGFRSRYVHSSVYLGENGSPFHARPDQAYIDTLNPVIDGLTVWGSRDGVLMNYNERMSLRNARLIGTGAPWVQNGGTADTGVGIDMYNEVSRGPGVIENVSIEGFGVGLLAPRQDVWTVNNLQLANTTDLVITEARQSARTLDMNDVSFGSLNGTAVENTAGQRRNVVMEADTEGDGYQPYFFLLSNRIRLNGQSLYFDQQADDYVPLESSDSESIVPIPQEFVGLTNQQLWNTYGTSFGGAIIPPDATTVSIVDGGVVGSAPTATPTTPPLYDMTNEGGDGILVNPGTLTNFNGAVAEATGESEPVVDESGEGDDHQSQMHMHDEPMHLAGDVDADNDVDGADLMAWQRNAATIGEAQAAADLAAWQTNFGATSDHSHHGHPSNPHPDDPVRAGEHMAAMDLVDVAQVTHTVVASGNWSDPSIWANNELPNDMARVHIPEGITLTVDGVIDETIYTVRIDGTLRFDPTVDTQLIADTIVGTPTSRFEMGTPEAPINDEVTARVLVADTGEIDRSWDPHALSRGLILHGTSVINGATKNPWSTLQVAPRAGDSTITLDEQPEGWQVGDTLVIAGTKLDATGDEVVTIAAIDGQTITLGQPLSEDHVPPADDLKIHVSNTTRNAVIQSESTEVARRGHVMFMHNPDVQVAYAGFYDLGRTDKSISPNFAELDEEGRLVDGTGTNVPGRYSVHFHRHGVAADTPVATVTGSSVVGSPGWGYVNHSSHVDLVDNVSYDVFGAAFYTEAGDEIGSFVNNLSIKTHGSGESPVSRGFEGEDLGHSGDGFWFQGGTGLTVRNNVATGATGSGLIVYGVEAITESVPEIPFLAENLPDPSLANGAATVPAGLTWLGEFSGNTAYGSAVGLQTYYHRSPISTDFEGQAEQLLEYQFDFPNSLIEDTTVWNSDFGVLANYNVDIHFRNVRVLNAPDQVGETGFDVSNVYNLGEHIYENLDIRGFGTGLKPSPNGNVTIDGGTFANGADIYLGYPRQNHRRLDIRGDIEFLDLPGDFELDEERQNIVASSDTRILVDSSDQWFLYYDHITLNYGDFTGQQLFHLEQVADYVPFPEQPEQVTPDDPGGEVPEEFLGLTNAEMQEQFGVSLGGVVATPDAVDAPDDGIVGLVGSPSEPPETLIPQLLLGSDQQIADLLGEGGQPNCDELGDDELDGGELDDESNECPMIECEDDLGDEDCEPEGDPVGEENGGDEPDMLVGDFNGDDEVNLADLLVWRETFGQRVIPSSGADADGNGIVGLADLDILFESLEVDLEEDDDLDVNDPEDDTDLVDEEVDDAEEDEETGELKALDAMFAQL